MWRRGVRGEGAGLARNVKATAAPHRRQAPFIPHPLKFCRTLQALTVLHCTYCLLPPLCSALYRH